MVVAVLAVTWWEMRKTDDSAALASGEKVLSAERAAGLHPVLFAALSEWEISGPFPVRVGWRGGLRTAAEQAALYAVGRSLPGSIVTNAETPEASAHGRGAAVDLYPVDARGESLPEEAPQWLALGQWFEARGFVWGGRWTTLHDAPHVEIKDWRALPYPPPDYEVANG